MQSKKSLLSSAVNIIILSVFAFICIYPLYYILINSFSSPGAIAKGVYIIPQQFTTEAYVSLKEIAGIGSSVIISILRTVLGSLLTVFCCSFVAYILVNPNLPARKAFYRFFILTMYINAGFIPFYLLVTKIGLKNNFLVYILPSAVSGYFIILAKTYMESIPSALIESAEIDGAGILTIYFRVILPLAKPILACVIVFAAVNQWNSWADDMYFISGSAGRDLHCLQYLLYQKLQSNMAAAVSGGSAAAGSAVKVTSTTLRMAMTFVTVLPILCVYPFMQRFFTKGIMLGAVKG